MKMNKKTAALLGILVLALAMRLIFFNGLNWDDDPDYVYRAYLVKTGQNFIFTDNNGFRIGTYYPAALFYALFGINDFSCGAYALVVSLLSVAVIYKLGKLLFNPRTGLIAALLLAFYPLDVELASRLMPDGLLAGFTLFAVYCLYRGDEINLNSESTALESPWSYIACGLLLGWCTMVNMSAVVIILYAAIYFIISLIAFRNKLTRAGFVKGLWRIVALRYVLLVGGFLFVVVIEGACYYKVTGDFFFKYHNTLSHYAGEHGFCRDLTMYPRIMFHLNSLGKFQFQGIEYSYYGFYYIIALCAFIYGLFTWKRTTCCITLWLFTVFAYLQWGSMSFTHYTPFHRLPRHLSLATPAMILCIAYCAGNFKPVKFRTYVSTAVVAFLVLSSTVLCYYRHEYLLDSVLPQAAIHTYLEKLNPRFVYAANNTIAYQRFLDKFKEQGRQYLDIRSAHAIRQRDAYAITGEFRNWQDVVREVLPNPSSVPANWKVEKAIRVAGRLNKSPYTVKVYHLLTTPIEDIELTNSNVLKRYLLRKFPEAIKESSKLILAWECDRVDGVEEIIVRDKKLEMRHIEFNEPEEVSYSIFSPVLKDTLERYRVLKDRGRGDVRVIELPNQKNNFSLRLRVDDGAFPSSGYYLFYVVADAPER
jgi:4-amino-4-deoxy-L-arabinose transferase-like glycosyltransferase